MAAGHPGMSLWQEGVPFFRTGRPERPRPCRPTWGAHSKAAGNRERFLFGNGPTFQDVNESAGRQLREVASEQLRLRCLLARVASSRDEKVWKGNCVFLSGMENENRLLEKPQP